ncbi:MAG: HEPN domain-containing protein [Patescibacteria group bacterium]|nr:HEPN domain-containing protein [Patescibacteria group bacterium]
MTVLRALLILECTSPETHSGVRILINLRFIRAKKLSPLINKQFDFLYRLRTDIDYSDFVSVTEKEAKESLSIAKKTLKNIEDLIRKISKDS